MLFCQQTQKTHSYYNLVTSEPPFILTKPTKIEYKVGKWDHGAIHLQNQHPSTDHKVISQLCVRDKLLCQIW